MWFIDFIRYVICGDENFTSIQDARYAYHKQRPMCRNCLAATQRKLGYNPHFYCNVKCKDMRGNLDETVFRGRLCRYHVSSNGGSYV